VFGIFIIKVWATMRTPSKWDQEDKSNITVAALDVTSEESIATLIKEIIEKEGIFMFILKGLTWWICI
jgi:NAD(P)-dependent dehydrogenase (short-subunit alcohol dehydrogenase family)